MFRKTPLTPATGAFVRSLSFVLVVAAGSLASPAIAQTSHDPSDWFGAQVVIGGSTRTGGWTHADAQGAGGGESWNASGSADIDFAQLKATASTSPRGPGDCHPWFCNYRSTVVASAWDIITLTNSTDSVQYVPYEFGAEGTVSEGDWGWGRGFARYNFASDATGWFNVPQVDITYSPLRVSGTLRLDPAQSLTRYWFAAIGAEAGDGGTADFGHTMRFSWVLPEGVNYTSASGSFMSGSDLSAVPEPAAWALMIVGFGLVGGALRRAHPRLGLAPAVQGQGGGRS